mgnify:CR=1 FL=1
MGEHNLKAIKKGDTWTFDLKFFEDQCESTPIDVSTYVFKLMAKNSSGTTIFTWDNAIFVNTANNERKVTLSPATTATYPVGEYQYDLQVTIGSNSYTWMAGYVDVVDQITS